MQINVFNPFTYTLETIIQSGARNLSVQSVPIRTNAPTRPSRLYRGLGTYLRKSIATIFRVYTLYKPLKTFFALGSLLLLAGAALGARFLWHFAEGDRAGHIQSLILAAVFLIVGFQTILIGLVADLISVNRRLSEEVLIRLKRMEAPEATKARPREQQQQRPDRRERPQRPAAPAASAVPAAPAAPAAATQKPQTQWVWLMDEDKLQDRGIKTEETAPPPAPPQAEPDPAAPSSRRRRRRRGGVRQNADLPGNRGKHLAGNDSGE